MPARQTYVIDERGCWNWQGALDLDGYAKGLRRKHNGGGLEQRMARWFFEDVKGSIPDGLTIDHLCRNRACVNPDHLEAVTVAENTRRGSSAKLTREQVAQIRSLCQEGWQQTDIAKAYAVNQSQVSRIQHGKRWVAA